MGLVETRRHHNEAGKFTLIFLAAPQDEASAHERHSPELELTYNWDSDEVYRQSFMGAFSLPCQKIYMRNAKS